MGRHLERALIDLISHLCHEQVHPVITALLVSHMQISYQTELHTDLIFWVTITITNSWTAALNKKVMNIALVLDNL